MTHELAPTRRVALFGAGCALAVRPARAEAPAARIASLGGAVTEILWRLGAARRIAVVDTTSIYPAEVQRQKPNAGYLRALSAEGLLSVRPDLVIAAEGAGPPAVLALVEEAGVPVRWVREPPSAEGVLDKIALIGRLAGLELGADALRLEVADRFAALAAARGRVERPIRALVVLSLTNGCVSACNFDPVRRGIGVQF